MYQRNEHETYLSKNYIIKSDVCLKLKYIQMPLS